MADGGDAMRARVAEKPEVATPITLAEAGIDKNLAERRDHSPQRCGKSSEKTQRDQPCV